MSRWDHLVGRTVVYTPAPGIVPGDEGVVTSANDRFVFVRFGADKLSKACYPRSLVLLSGERVEEMDV